MESPFRSEEAAFRFLLLTIGAFALIVVASWIDDLLGFVVFLVLSGAAVWAYLRQRGPRPEPVHVDHVGAPDERRVLVVANETVGGAELIAAIGERAIATEARFLVVCPALNSRLKTWTSDEDGARLAAQERLDATLGRLRSVGVEATGEVGDLDPLVAMEDAVRGFHPDEIVVSTHPLGRSNWLERGVVAAARERFDMPVTHVVVDLSAQTAESAEEPAAGADPVSRDDS
jgi:GABA permease